MPHFALRPRQAHIDERQSSKGSGESQRERLRLEVGIQGF
jgi:hypothetical protein